MTVCMSLCVERSNICISCSIKIVHSRLLLINFLHFGSVGEWSLRMKYINPPYSYRYLVALFRDVHACT